MSVRTRPGLFLLSVAVVSVPFFVLGVVSAGGRIGAMRLPASAVMFLVPALVAIVLAARQGGGAAVRELMSRLVDRAPRPWGWYMVAAALFPVVTVLVCAAVAPSTRDQRSEVPSAMAVPVLAAVFVLAAACEELGWTAYATDTLQQRIGQWCTGIGLGVFWAGWHVVPLSQAGHPLSWIAGWFATTVGARCLIIGLYNRSHAAVGVAVLAHAGLNLANAYTPALDAAITMWALAGLTAAVALTIPHARRDRDRTAGQQPRNRGFRVARRWNR